MLNSSIIILHFRANKLILSIQQKDRSTTNFLHLDKITMATSAVETQGEAQQERL